MYKLKFKGFTLVELIIVITILGILSTIGFIGFNKYIKNSRDSNRLSSISVLQKGLELSSINSGKYPTPDGVLLTGSVNGQILVYMGTIGESVSRNINLIIEVKDPLNNSNYAYGVTSDYKNYQIGGILELGISYNPIVNKVYAENEKARVIGNYKGLLKFSSGSEIYLLNSPSILFSNTGGTNLASSGTYYIVDKKANLPYNIKGIKDSSIQNIDGNIMIKDLTKSTGATLTGVNITEIIKGNKKVEEIFTGVLLESFNIYGNDLTNNKAVVDNISKIILSTSGNIKDTTSNGVGCNTTSYSGYTIPNMTHGFNQIISRSITNGTGNINVNCNNGIITYGSETISCISNYVVSSGTCVSDTCIGSLPANATSNGTQSYTGSWNYSLTTGVCTYSCQSGYYYSSGNCIASVNGTCSGIVSNAIYSNSGTTYTLSGALNGTSLIASYSINPSNNTCQFKCNSGFIWNGSNCTASVNGNCTGIPSNASYYNGFTSYTLSNATSGTSLTANYRGTPRANTCEYKCNSGYVNNGSGGCTSFTCGDSLSFSGFTYTTGTMPDGRCWTSKLKHAPRTGSYWCYGGNCNTYGAYYDSDASLNNCSELGDGWRVPTLAELTTLSTSTLGVSDPSLTTNNSRVDNYRTTIMNSIGGIVSNGGLLGYYNGSSWVQGSGASECRVTLVHSNGGTLSLIRWRYGFCSGLEWSQQTSFTTYYGNINCIKN